MPLTKNVGQFGGIFHTTYMNSILEQSILCPAQGKELPNCNVRYTSKKMTPTFEDTEGFFRRVLDSYPYKFPKRGAAFLMDLSELRLCLQSCVCVFQSCVCVFRAVFVMAKQNSNGKVSTNARHFERPIPNIMSSSMQVKWYGPPLAHLPLTCTCMYSSWLRLGLCVFMEGCRHIQSSLRAFLSQSLP